MSRWIGRSICRRCGWSLAAGAQLAAAHALLPHAARAAEARAATTDVQPAADLRARADAAMDGGAFAEAIAGYQASYELSRNPALLYDIGSAYERLGDYPRALAYLERFDHAATIDLRRRVPHLGEIIDTVRARLARVQVHCNVPGARVVIRGIWHGTTPLGNDILTPPGDARIEVLAQGYQPFSRNVVLAAGKATQLDANLVDARILSARSADGAHQSPADAWTTRWWFWTSLGVIAAAGATVAIVALTRDPRSSSTDCGMTTRGAAGGASLRTAGRPLAQAALVTW